MLCVLTAVGALTLLLPFLLGWSIWGFPPHLAHPRHSLRHLSLCLTEPDPHGDVPPLSRAWLFLRIVFRIVEVPCWGCAWYLDEVIFGRRLRAQAIRQPLFLMSAARSGSTQLAHYLESDPALVAPVMLQVVFPYLWLWHLVVPTIGRVVRPEWLEARFNEAIPLEMKQRHEGHPLRTDTFEVLWLLNTSHVIASRISPRVLSDEIVFMGSAPHNRSLWDHTLVHFVDRIGRKTLLFSGGSAHAQRLFIKGHFLEARDALARHFPDAHFLTTVRDPLRRIESAINHLHANAIEEPLGAVPWRWIVPALLQAEAAYCETEQEWFCAAPDRRTVVRFRDYVDDLPGTMKRVYAECLQQEAVPEHVPHRHVPRRRSQYAVHRTLEELGIDQAALARRLHGYRVWCGAVEPSKPPAVDED